MIVSVTGSAGIAARCTRLAKKEYDWLLPMPLDVWCGNLFTAMCGGVQILAV